MTGGDNTTDGICRCGHPQSDHLPQEHPAHGLSIPGHGPCSKSNCDCKKFRWAADAETPEARELIRRTAEKRALSSINAIAEKFGIEP